MRRLTLILSDLYLPEDSGSRELPRTHALPSLDWLLRFADRQVIGDWRRWMRIATGQHDRSPLAVLAGAPDAPLERNDDVWLATPVQLEARLDHVRLVDQGLLRLDERERTDLCAEIHRVFGPENRLRDAGDRAFQLIGLESARAPGVDPARRLGAEIGPALPDADSAQVRRLWAEIEMWLHGSALNAERERARKPRISALWLWGNEPGPAGDASVRGRTTCAIYGGDPLLRGLALRAGGARQASSYADVSTQFDDVFAEFAPLTGGPGESLSHLETHWFAPARSALDRHELEFVQVVANDRLFRLTPRAGWKFWRPKRSWLESLA